MSRISDIVVEIALGNYYKLFLEFSNRLFYFVTFSLPRGQEFFFKWRGSGILAIA